MFWTEDISVLLIPTLLPTDYMSFDEKMNTLTRLVIFICIILSLITQDINIILFMMIIMIFIIIIYKYSEKYRDDIAEKFLNENDLEVIDNLVCIKPSINNPMMNPNITHLRDYSKNEISGACPSFNENIEKQIEEIFDKQNFINSNDLYNRSSLLKRQFYTVPGDSIPNDQNEFGNWLYNRGPSCKEGNSNRCYTNMYRDIRL
jgi:Ca2+/Na+ antiporter